MEGLNKPTSSYFQAADYVIFGLMMLISLAIGLYFRCSGGRQRTSAEYVLADRSMTLLPVTLSLLSSFFSGISMQGIPADVYYHGPLVIWSTIPLVIGGFLARAFFLPMYYSLGLTSVYEYLGMRFNGVVTICGVVSFLLFALFYMGLVIYVACVAATAVMDVSLVVATVCVCAVCAVYTVIGGIKAVLWTDSLQMLLMVATILAVICKGVMDLGLRHIWETSVRGHRADFFRFHTDLTDFYNGWGFIIGRITMVNVLVDNQYMVQRMVVCKSERVARLAIYGYIIGVLFVHCILVLAGMTMYAYYEHCDPTTLGYIKKNDEILPYFVIDVFGHLPGVPGLLLTGLFGAALSTMSSVLNAIATLIGEHFVKPFARGMKDTTYAFVLKILVVVASMSTLGVTFIIPYIGDVVAISLTISAASQGTLLALYVLGAFFPFCGSKNAVAGYVTGLILGVVLSVGVVFYQERSENLPLSADMCLNGTTTTTSLYYETVAAATSLTADDVTLWTSKVTQTVTTDTYRELGNRPLIFTLSKIWLAVPAFITTMLVALGTVLITGVNDTSKLDPRLVVWKINSSYTPASTDQKGYSDEYSDIEDMDEHREKATRDNLFKELSVRKASKDIRDNEETNYV